MGYAVRRLICALLISVPSLLYADDTLVFVVDIIRHGDRTPIAPLPSVNYQWKEGLGQLTAEGMQQEYKMGVAFRKRYIEQAHLLPEHYEYGTMYVRATDFERTLMSAQSLLMGLYPAGTGPNISGAASLPALPHAFQPIPVFSAPAKYDEVILQQVSQKERTKLMEEYVYSTKEWQQKDNELKDQYPLWSQALGVQINSLKDLELMGDSLYVHQVHNAPMPNGLSSHDIRNIIDVSNWSFMAQERPRQVANAYNSKLMTNIARFLNQGGQDSKLKYVLLSAHDTTIAGALSFLGAPLENAPPYASNLNFSLYESGSGYYTVKVTYNGTPVSIPGCGGPVCELQQFIKLVNDSKNYPA